ncbi:MAG: hypothetical protein SFV23_11690 [Planctomycetaceae bacterium]|nr:hypothetical protein [Planctomycetaceae bacterium]
MSTSAAPVPPMPVTAVSAAPAAVTLAPSPEELSVIAPPTVMVTAPVVVPARRSLMAAEPVPSTAIVRASAAVLVV